MSIKRAPRPETRYVVLNKDMTENQRLSWEARGLLSYLLGKPDNWVVSIQNLEMPEVYKVGMTARSPHARAAELSSVTGVPVSFDVVYYAEVADPAAQEKRVHEALAKYRVNTGREFFKTDLYTIIQAIKDPDSAFTDDEPPIYSEWSSAPIIVIERVAKFLSADVEGTA